jgi:hypothetical protein
MPEVPRTIDGSTPEVRWAQWLQRGRDQDKRAALRMKAFLAVAIPLVTIAIAWFR